MRLRGFLNGLLLVLLLTGCGQKGPLYLPDEPAPEPPEERQADEDDDEDNEPGG